MRKLIQVIAIILFSTFSHITLAQGVLQKTPVNIIKKMFRDFSEAKNITVIDQYYSKDFVLVSNLKTYSYAAYKKQQKSIFKKIKRLHVLSYDDLFYSGNQVAGRVIIRLTMRTGVIHTFHVIFIAKIYQGKIIRLWEMTNPTWSDKLVINHR